MILKSVSELESEAWKPIIEFLGLEEVMIMDGFDDCLVGFIERNDLDNPIACYDEELVVDKLVADGMTRDEAKEYFEFNQAGAWMGEGTPCFLSRRFEIAKTPCCKVFTEFAMKFNWFQSPLSDDGAVLPHIIDDDGERWRVNFCPSCGRYIRQAEFDRPTR